MKIRHTLLPLVLLASLGGCDQLQTSLNKDSATAGDSTGAVDTGDTTTADAMAPAGETLATVNGSTITSAVLDIYQNQRMAKGGNPEAAQEDILNELITLEIMRQEAVKQGLDRKPSVAATLDQLQRSALAGAAIQAWLNANPISDEAIQEAYDSQFGAPGKEYNARHVLVESEEDARVVISRLDNGEDFSELAKEKSTGPTGPSGGKLGWFNAGQMVPEFSDAAAALEKGSYTKEPVKTQFGWHVIMLDDVRDSTPPPFEDVKERIRMVLSNQQLQTHIVGLREAAGIEIK